MEKTTKEEFEERLAQIVARGADVTADTWMKEIEAEYGRVPLIFKRMGERPEVLISHLLYKGTVGSDQPARSKICRTNQPGRGSSTQMSTLHGIPHAGSSQNGCEQGRDPGSDPAGRYDIQLIGARELLPYL